MSPSLLTLNRASYVFIATACLAGSGFFVGQLIARILQIVPNHDVPVPVPFHATSVELPVGAHGAGAAVAVTQGVIHVSGMPGITLASLLLADVVRDGATAAVIVLFAVLCIRMARSRTFDRGSVRLATASGLVIVGAWMLGTLFANMGVNGAFAVLSDRTYDNAIYPVDFTGLFAGVAVLIVSVVFDLGRRMRQDTEGLV